MNINEINKLYKVNNNDKSIQIFGDNFVKNNKNNCKMILNGKESEIKNNIKYFNRNSGNLIIKLQNITNITDMSYMFCNCPSLILYQIFQIGIPQMLLI